MATPGPGNLTKMALALRDEDNQFNLDWKAATQKMGSSPEQAVKELDACWVKADGVEQHEKAFERALKQSGMPDVPDRSDHWRQVRSGIQTSKGMALFSLARIDEADTALKTARNYVRAGDEAESILDSLEIAILQARA